MGINTLEQILQETKDLTKLSETIFEHCKQKNISVKQDVINRFVTSLYNSYRSFQKLLIDGKQFTDSVVIGRRIIEIYIRTEYLKQSNLLALFDKMKYLERAELLRRLIQSNRPENIVSSTLWKSRKKIIKKNKEVRDELDKKKYERYKIKDKKLPSIEVMAEVTGLTYLYKMSYGTWSKFVHCNASLEGYLKYKDNEEIKYVFGNEYEIIGQENYVEILKTVNYVVYLFLITVVDLIKLGDEDINQFKEKHIRLKIFDLYTGRSSSNYDFMKTFLESMGVKGVDETWFEGIEEKSFLKGQKKDFDNTHQGKYITLEEMVKKVENTLKTS